MNQIKDKPWLIRTYAGHSSAKASNSLYRKNMEKGQTGLSVAFDLPTQTGYDSDHILAKGEVGKVGVPISHIGNMEELFNKIPLEKSKRAQRDMIDFMCDQAGIEHTVSNSADYLLDALPQALLHHV